jgi:HD superfamily phosphohydrolase
MDKNKRKIINDPVYGFIAIPREELYDLIQSPYVQRLRRIKQLGLSNLVYPGAEHTRFSHSIGAMYLMNQALNVLQEKGEDISEEEYSASLQAILLHDVGHAPFSHCLESFFFDSSHEDLSLHFMKDLNLSDIVTDIFDDMNTGCAFKNGGYSEEYEGAFLKALEFYTNNPACLNIVIKNAMNRNCGWDFSSLEKYNDIYEELI